MKSRCVTRLQLDKAKNPISLLCRLWNAFEAGPKEDRKGKASPDLGKTHSNADHEGTRSFFVGVTIVTYDYFPVDLDKSMVSLGWISTTNVIISDICFVSLLSRFVALGAAHATPAVP